MSMAELGLASAVAGLLSLGITTCSGISKYYSTWKDYDNDITRTCHLIENLNNLLKTSESTLSSEALGNHTTATERIEAAKLIESGKRSISDLSNQLDKLHCASLASPQPISFALKVLAKGSRSFRRLMYPFRQETLKKLRDSAWEANDCVTKIFNLLHIALSSSTAQGVMTLKNIAEDCQTKRERREILDWLCRLDSGDRMKELLSRHCPGTGEWIAESDHFQSWINSSQSGSRGLWYCGKMGCGKSMMMALATRYLQRHLPQSSDAVLYHFIDWKDIKTQSPTNILGGAIRQLVELGKSIPKPVIDEYEHHQEGKARMGIKEQLRLFRQISRPFIRLAILVDGLDECNSQEPDYRAPNMLILENIFGDILHEQSNVYILVSSRFKPSPTVEHLFRIITLKPRQKDIAGFIEHEMTNTSVTAVWRNHRVKIELQANKELFEKVVRNCTAQSGDMFLIAKFYVASIRSQFTIRDLDESLSNLPQDLDSSVNSCLDRIDAQERKVRDLSHRVLMWLYAGCRPFKLAELQDGISVGDGDTIIGETAKISHELIIMSCAGLVEWDPDTDIIRLAHLFVKKKLERMQPKWLTDAHLIISQSAIAYLGLGVFEPAAKFNRSQFQQWTTQYSFLSYAAEYWATHVRHNTPDSETMVRLLTFVEKGDRAIFLLRAAYAVLVHEPLYCPNETTTLHVAAFFGLRELASVLLDRGDDIDATDDLGRMPLFFAAAHGHQQMVDLLLSRSANVTGVDFAAGSYRGWRRGDDVSNWWCPSWAQVGRRAQAQAIEAAAERGFESVIRMLVKAGANITNTGGLHGSALEAAIFNGHTGLVRYLLQQDTIKASMLQSAVFNGDTEILNIVISRMEAQSNLESGGQDRTLGLFETVAQPSDLVMALYAASLLGRQNCVDVLIRRGVDPNGGVKAFYQSPLQAAASRGHIGILSSLINSGADVNKSFEGDEYSRHRPPYPHGTALNAASYNGHLAAVELLLSHGAKVTNSAGRQGTPLQSASVSGHLEIVKMLLENGANAHQIAGFYGNAFNAAVSGGHADIADIYIRAGAQVDKSPVEGQSLPLINAALSQSPRLVKLLLEKGADPNTPDQKYGCAMQAACVGVNPAALEKKTREAIISGIEPREVRKNLKDFLSEWERYYRRGLVSNVVFHCTYGSMLQHVTGGRFEEKIETNLEKGILRELWKDCDGTIEILKVLLEYGADINTIGGRHHLPLNAAIKADRTAVVEFLINKGANTSLQFPEEQEEEDMYGPGRILGSRSYFITLSTYNSLAS